MPEPLASLAAELEDFHQQRRPVVFEWNALHLVEEHLFHNDMRSLRRCSLTIECVLLQ